MSLHYTIHISLNLKESISPDELDILEYLINGQGHPSKFPASPCFKHANGLVPFKDAYVRVGFNEKQYSAVFWQDKQTKNHHIKLVLPSIKDPQGWWELLQFIDWFCSMSHKNAMIGYSVEEDEPLSVALLYSIGGKLYFFDKNNQEELTKFSEE